MRSWSRRFPRARARRAATAALAGTLATALAAPSDAAAQPTGDPIADAVSPAPAPLRADATVLGRADGRATTLREGNGPLVCLADDPAEEGFHVACYHRSLEPYMARGRALRAEGMGDRDALAARWKEIEAGTLAFPERAVLYSLSTRPPERGGTGRPDDLMALTVVYLNGATAEGLGVPTSPAEGIPWIMFPGTPTAHLMIHDPPPAP